MDYAMVPVAQRQLAGRAVADRVIAIGVGARLVGDQLVLAIAHDEEVVFDQGVRVGKTSPAQSDLERLPAITADAGEVLEQIVMDPGALRHPAAARSVNGEHLARGAFILEGIVINLAVIARGQQISSSARKLEDVTGEPAATGACLHLHSSNGVG